MLLSSRRLTFRITFNNQSRDRHSLMNGELAVSSSSSEDLYLKLKKTTSNDSTILVVFYFQSMMSQIIRLDVFINRSKIYACLRRYDHLCECIRQPFFCLFRCGSQRQTQFCRGNQLLLSKPPFDRGWCRFCKHVTNQRLQLRKAVS